jgi:hypothetical protein
MNWNTDLTIVSFFVAIFLIIIFLVIKFLKKRENEVYRNIIQLHLKLKIIAESLKTNNINIFLEDIANSFTREEMNDLKLIGVDEKLIEKIFKLSPFYKENNNIFHREEVTQVVLNKKDLKVIRTKKIPKWKHRVVHIARKFPWLIRLLNFKYSYCEKCGLTWNWVEPFVVETGKYFGVFAVCEHCFKKSTIEQLKEYYTSIYLMQKKAMAQIGYNDPYFSLKHLLNCVEDSYNEINNLSSNN